MPLLLTPMEVRKMASNETTAQTVNRFEGVTEYQNLTPASDLDQKTLNKMA